MEKTADVVILTHKPSELFLDIIDRLEEQSLSRRGRIILMNTGREYMDELLAGIDRLEGFDNIEIHHISRMSLIMAVPEKRRQSIPMPPF